MKILAIDTSSKMLSLALSEDKDIIIEESYLLDRKHSSLLVPKIKEMLEKQKFSIKDINAFVIGLGPGSFTGLRIGVSTIKGFGIATKKPCIGVPSIDALALALTEAKPPYGGLASVPIIDAKRGNVYSAIYENKNGTIVRKSRHLLIKIDDLMKRIKKPAVFFGDGTFIYKEKIIDANKKAVFLEEEYWYPKAGNLIKLGFPKTKKRYNSRELNRLDPIYLYPKDCQVKRTRRA